MSPYYKFVKVFFFSTILFAHRSGSSILLWRLAALCLFNQSFGGHEAVEKITDCFLQVFPVNDFI